MRLQFSSSGLPVRHETVLLVRTQPDFQMPMMAMSAGGGVDFGAMPGIDLLARMSSFGALKRVTLLARDSEAPEPAPPMPMAGAFAGAMASWARSTRGTASLSRGQRALAGAAVVEFESPRAAQEAGNRLRFEPGIASAAPAPARYLLLAPKSKPKPKATAATAPPPGLLWNHRAIRLAEARTRPGFREADQIRVAVLDTGIDASHPEFLGRVAGYRYAHPDGSQVVGPEDIVGHGSHVAGVIAANGSNSYGIDGICRPQLHVWKIFTDQTVLIPSWRAFIYVVDTVMYQRALADCVDQSIDVVNLSIGGAGAPDPVESELFAALYEAGTTVVAAMGNERRQGSPISYPAAIPGVVAVGASKIDDGIAAFSNRGAHIALCAPGVAIWSPLPTYPGRMGYEAVPDGAGGWKEGKPDSRETGFDAWDGTSMAAPHVAAAAALLRAKKPALTPKQVRNALMASADRVPGMGGAAFHPDFGAGRLNLERLL